MSKVKFMTTTWTATFNKPTVFGFSYRWWIPRFIYTVAMHDLKFIKRNDRMIYKKAGYVPTKEQKGLGGKVDG